MRIEQTYDQTGHKHWLTLVDADVTKAHRVNSQEPGRPVFAEH